MTITDKVESHKFSGGNTPGHPLRGGEFCFAMSTAIISEKIVDGYQDGLDIKYLATAVQHTLVYSCSTNTIP